MSDTVLEAPAPIAAGQSPGGVVCCSADLGLAAASARIPWLRLIIGALVAAQTMMLGLTINLTAGVRMLLDARASSSGRSA